MVELENLRVSLTKNGYQKIPILVQHHPRNEILDNVYGVHDGVNLAKSQVANILGADPRSDVVPSYWDGIRKRDVKTIEAFTFVAIVFSHHRLINALLNANQGRRVGYLSRDGLTSKEYTNLVYAMAGLGLCEYVRGAKGVIFDLKPILRQLRSVRSLVQQLLCDKLSRCGWRDPKLYPTSDHPNLLQQCQELRFHEVFGLSFEDFSEWFVGQRRSRA